MKIMFGFVSLISILIFTACSSTAPQDTSEESNTNSETAVDPEVDSSLETEDNSETNEGTYKTISAEEAFEMMENSDDYILLDVRTEEEFIEQRIEGAFLLPSSQVFREAEEKLPEKDSVLLVYCRSGRRSARASEQLSKMGYTNVYDFGGILDWPYDTVSGETDLQ